MASASPLASPPPSLSDSNSPFVVVMPEQRDAVDVLMREIGCLVEYFGPDARKRIEEGIQQDRRQAERMRNLEMELRRAGDTTSANRIVKHAHDMCKYMLGQVVPMRTCIRDIAEGLRELKDPEVLQSTEDTAAILQEINKAANIALGWAKRGKDTMDTLAVEFREIQQKHVEKADQADKETMELDKMASKLQCKADQHGCSSWDAGAVASVTGTISAAGSCVGVGVLHTAAAGGVSAVASLPGIGALLTSTSATVEMAGLATAVVNPVGVTVFAGFTAIFAIWSLTSYLARQQALKDRQQALEEKEEVVEKWQRASVVADEAVRAGEAANEMIKVVDYHQEMWQGIQTSADQVVHAFTNLRSCRPGGARRKAFDNRMVEFASQLSNFVKSIDMYLFFLSKAGLLPPNFDVRWVIGTKAYDAMSSEIDSEPALTAGAQENL